MPNDPNEHLKVSSEGGRCGPDHWEQAVEALLDLEDAMWLLEPKDDPDDFPTGERSDRWLRWYDEVFGPLIQLKSWLKFRGHKDAVERLRTRPPMLTAEGGINHRIDRDEV